MGEGAFSENLLLMRFREQRIRRFQGWALAQGSSDLLQRLREEFDASLDLCRWHGDETQPQRVQFRIVGIECGTGNKRDAAFDGPRQ